MEEEPTKQNLGENQKVEEQKQQLNPGRPQQNDQNQILQKQQINQGSSLQNDQNQLQ